MARTPYAEPHYRRVRRLQLGSAVLCAHCERGRATTLDHDPPLAMHRHRAGTSCCRLIPSCADCNREGGLLVQRGEWRPDASAVPLEAEPERSGLKQSDRRWRVPWLRRLRSPPANAVWPRLMTVPHPAATRSLGREFSGWAEARLGRELRWWQQLAAVRILEVDDDERLVWEGAILSMARQLGKSWLLRELCLWRIEQGERFGEPQDVLHTGKDLAVCKEVQRPARIWAKPRRERYRVREVNGQEEIELLGVQGGRWMLKAKGAPYGYGISFAVVDESWSVGSSYIEEGVAPTMVERISPQLLLVSTAHRATTSLMLHRRQAALADLESGEGDLLVEWSAPEGAALDDEAAWRLASPYWTASRQRLIEKKLVAMRAGEVEDPTEPDPVESFRTQWLNQWPRKRFEAAGQTERLLPPGLWADLAERVVSAGPVMVAVEDDLGLGAAVAAACRLPDGRVEVDGWLRPDWDTAIADVEQLAVGRRVRQLLVGASLLDRVPAGLPSARPAGTRETRAGLALLRDLAATGALVHDETTGELDAAMDACHVKEAASGLQLAARGPTHLVRALVWAVMAAHKPAKLPAIR